MNDTSVNNEDKNIEIIHNLIKNAEFLIKGFQDINKSINKNYIYVGKSLKDQERKGINKLISELKSEKKYLNKLLQNTKEIQPANIFCSNITYFSAIYQVALSERNVTNLYEPITYFNTETNTKETIRIDVISDNGLRWIKVKARNINNGNSKFQNTQDNVNINEKETLHLLNLLQKIGNATKQNLIHYKKPKIILKVVTYEPDKILNINEIKDKNPENENVNFTRKIKELETSIEKLSIKNPLYQSLKNEKSNLLKDEDEPTNNTLNLILKENYLFSNTLFLDITALIAIVSDLTNIPYSYIPSKPLEPIKPLYQQYLDEKSKDIPNFMKLFYSLLYVESLNNSNNLGYSSENSYDHYHYRRCHRQLITCITAVERFWKIVKIIAGPRELIRSIKLFEDSNLLRMKVIKKEMIDTLHQKFNIEFKNEDEINPLATTHDHCNFYDNLIKNKNFNDKKDDDLKIKESSLIDYTKNGCMPIWLPKVKVIEDQPSELFVELISIIKKQKINKNKKTKTKSKNNINNNNNGSSSNNNSNNNNNNNNNNNSNNNSSNSNNKEKDGDININDNHSNKRKIELHKSDNSEIVNLSERDEQKGKKVKIDTSPVKENEIIELNKSNSNTSPCNGNSYNVNKDINNSIEALDSTEIIFGTAEALHMTLITSNDKKIKTIITEWKEKNEQILKEIANKSNINNNNNNNNSNDNNTIATKKQNHLDNNNIKQNNGSINYLTDKIKNNIHNYNFSYWIHPPRSLIEVRAFSKE